MKLSTKTTLDEIARECGRTIGDISIVDLLEYLRNYCLSVGKDPDYQAFPEEAKWAADHAMAAEHLQAALEAIIS